MDGCLLALCPELGPECTIWPGTLEQMTQSGHKDESAVRRNPLIIRGMWNVIGL